jgi:hypothetical protein
MWEAREKELGNTLDLEKSRLCLSSVPFMKDLMTVHMHSDASLCRDKTINLSPYIELPSTNVILFP